MKFSKLNYFDPNRKEEKFIKNLKVKTRVKFVNLLLMIQKLLFANYMIFTSYFRFLYVFPMILVYSNLSVNILNEFNSYERVKKFYDDIDK